MTTSEFLAKVQRIAEELAAAGRSVPEDEQGILYSLGGSLQFLGCYPWRVQADLSQRLVRPYPSL
jgi:hypothetical protein